MSDLFTLYVFVCFAVHMGMVIGAHDMLDSKVMILGAAISQGLSFLTVPIIIGTNFK